MERNPTTSRIEGWEGRLSAVIDGARNKPYVLGQWDCFRMACAVIEALTGVDRWREFSGSYKSEREALVAIARHGSNFEEAGDWFFGPRMGKKLARRGDIVALIDPYGKKHLGVCSDGVQVAVMLDTGLFFVRLSNEHCLCAWRVG